MHELRVKGGSKQEGLGVRRKTIESRNAGLGARTGKPLEKEKVRRKGSSNEEGGFIKGKLLLKNSG